MEVMVILPRPPQLHKEHKDPCVLDQDNRILQGSVENKSCSKRLKIIIRTILKVVVILSCPPQLQEVHKDPCNLDKDNNFCF